MKIQRLEYQWSFILICLLLALALLLSACNPGMIPQSGVSAPELAITVEQSAISAGGPVAPGITTISLRNNSQEMRTVMLARLNPDVTSGQFTETLSTDDLAAVNLVKLAGGRDTPAGETRTFTSDLKSGTYVALSFPDDDNAIPLLTFFEVAGAATEQAVPESLVTVNMVDFSFVMPETMTAGAHNWEITNTGNQWHEFVILKAQPGLDQAQLLEIFNNYDPSQGPPPFEDVGSFGPLSEGERGWITFDLPAGTYMAVCFLPDMASGESHLEKGMIYTFEIR